MPNEAQMRERLAELTADFTRADDERSAIIAQYGDDRSTWPAGQITRADNLGRRLTKITEDMGEVEQRLEQVDLIRRNAVGGGIPGDGRGVPNGSPTLVTRSHANPWDGLDDRMAGDTPTGIRARALDALAVVPDAPQAARSAGGELVEHDPTGAAARWVLASGDPAYLRAFAHAARDPMRGHLLWTEAERAAFARAEYYNRAAMSLSDANGGYLVPFTLDPTIMLTNAGVTSNMRQIARVVQTATDSWNGVTSAGVTAEWHTEGDEVADASPTLGQPSIPVHTGDAYVTYSIELGMDSSLVAQLGGVFADAKTRLEEVAFATGSGTGNEPRGLITAVAADSGSIVTPDTAETFAAADVFSVQNALPARHQMNARWAANLAVLNTMAQLETTNGAKMFPELGQNPPILLRKPVTELSTMDNGFDASATANNYVLAYGDFTNYVIADRVGSRVEFLNLVTGANGRPTGQRGALFYWRTGADCVNTDAFRLLNVATTA